MPGRSRNVSNVPSSQGEEDSNENPESIEVVENPDSPSSFHSADVIIEATSPQPDLPTSPIPVTPLNVRRIGYELGTPTGTDIRLGINSPFSLNSPDSRTPLRQRRDLQSEQRHRQVTIDSELDELSLHPTPNQQNMGMEPKLVIWGTDVVLSDCKIILNRFITEFKTSLPEFSEAYDPDIPFYMQKLREIELSLDPFLIVDADHVKNFNENIYRQLVTYPQEVIPSFDSVVNQLFFDLFPTVILEHQIQVRIMNIDKTTNMRNLNPEDIDRLITMSGMVTRTSQIIPEMHEAFFECYICKWNISVELNCGIISEPNVCGNCNASHSLSIIHNRSVFTDKQVIKLQESPDEMPAGQTPFTIMLFAHNDLVEQVHPGDRVTVTGIYRAAPVRLNPRLRAVRAVYRTYIDVIHFKKSDEKKFRGIRSETGVSYSKEREEEIIKLSKLPDIYTRLARSFAPGIYENVDVKKGIVLQLLGGTDKVLVGRSHFRSEINILLCGDPGTSKSQILKYVHGLIPRGQYTSGKGSSAVGLTAYVTRDPDTRQYVLQTGALVLSDNGICCIDEFDKMSESTRSILHEVMEQQTISIAKAGIICQLNARTSILAAANPIKSKWDTKLTTVANIQLSHTLLSRFDLIFIILDHQNEDYDRNIAMHLVALYNSGANKPNELEEMDLNLLKDYIAYARSKIKPRLTEESAEFLVQSYLEMRKAGNLRGAITAYPRQLESLIRLSEAHAKARLSHFVDISDVVEAKRLHREALMQSCIDPKTGMIDVNILTSGFSESDRKTQAELASHLQKYFIDNGGSNSSHQYLTLLDFARKSFDSSISNETFEAALRTLQDDNAIIFGSGRIVRVI